MSEPYAYEVRYEDEDELVYAGWLEKYASDVVRACPRIPLYKHEASQPKPLTDAQLDAAILEWFSYERDQDDFRARMRAAVAAATKEHP